MATTTLEPSLQTATAAELRRLPAAERDRILRAAAACAEADYTHDKNLTAFEAFTQEDLHGRSSNSESR